MGKRRKLAKHIIREISGFAPYERRVMELLRNGLDKRALKLAKKRVQIFCFFYLKMYHFTYYYFTFSWVAIIVDYAKELNLVMPLKKSNNNNNKKRKKLNKAFHNNIKQIEINSINEIFRPREGFYSYLWSILLFSFSSLQT